MDSYPPDLVSHNVPLVVLSSLGSPDIQESEKHAGSDILREGGFRIRVDHPAVAGDLATNLLQAFFSHNSTNTSSTTSFPVAKDACGPFKIRNVGRVGQTPHALKINTLVTDFMT